MKIQLNLVVIIFLGYRRDRFWALFFLLYVNDLSAHIVSECRLFADDAALYNIRQNKDILQQDLLKLESWSKLCSVLSFEDPRLERGYYLNNTRIKNVKITRTWELYQVTI